MKKYLSGLFAVGLLAASTTIAAQGRGQNPAGVPPPDTNAPPGVQQTPRAPAAQVRTQSDVTITGCLQNAPAVAATSPARGSTATSFVLANPQITASGDAAAAGAVGTTGTAPTTYSLAGDEKLMTPHLNHQVRVTGKLQSSSASATGAANAAPGSTAAGPTLNVESVEMVSATCPAPKAPAATAPRTPPPAEPARPTQPTLPVPGQPVVPPDR